MVSMPKGPINGVKYAYKPPGVIKLGQKERLPDLRLNRGHFLSIHRTALKLSDIDNILKVSGRTCGTNEFIRNKLSLASLGETLASVSLEHLILINARFEDVLKSPAIGSYLRGALALKNYIDTFSRVAAGELEIVSNGTDVSFREIEVRETRKRDSTLSLLKNGDVEYDLAQNDLTPSMRLQLFLHTLINAADENNSPPNSIFIKCSPRASEMLKNGNFWDFIWFSFSKNYSAYFYNRGKMLHNFLERKSNQSVRDKLSNLGIICKNERGLWIWAMDPTGIPLGGHLRPHEVKNVIHVWHNDPDNSVVLQIQLTKEAYLKLLNRFADRIIEHNLNGTSKGDRKSSDLIPKIEKGVPTFALRKGDRTLEGTIEVKKLRDDFENEE